MLIGLQGERSSMIRPLRASIFLFTAVTLLAGARSSLAADPAADEELLRRVVVPPKVAVASISQGAWSAKWWQWAASFLHEESPVADLTGQYCGNGQEGPVWFLAGTYESRLVTRHCTVPRDKYLFFPLINYVVAPPEGGSVGCKETALTAKGQTDDPLMLVAEIDGTKVPGLRQYRQASPRCFNLASRARSDVSIGATAANGYYLMLYPLAPGVHTLRFGGRLSALTQAVSYELTVE
jgi:hypothetical protein